MSPLQDGPPAHIEEPVEPVAAAVRSPLRDISPPPAPAFPQHNDDIEMEPRRRLPEASSLNSASTTGGGDRQSRPIAGLPSRLGKTSTGGPNDLSDAEPSSLSTSSPYFRGNSEASNFIGKKSVNAPVQQLDFNFESTWRQVQPTLPSPPYDPPNVSFDFDFFDDLDQENQPPLPDDKGKGRQISAPMVIDDLGSDEYDMDDENDFADPMFLENIDKLEKAALQRGTSVISTNNPPSGSVSILGGSTTSDVSLRTSARIITGGSSVKARTAPLATMEDDVIEIDDSGDEILEAEDKENAPVPTRHIRRKIETKEHSQNQSRSQRNRPVILAAHPEDVIDLSD